MLQLIVRSPLYLFEYVVGFALAAISDITTTSVVLTGVFVGLATGNVWAGLASFFGIHTAIKIVNAVNGAIVQNARASVTASRILASVFNNTERPTPASITPPEESSEG